MIYKPNTDIYNNCGFIPPKIETTFIDINCGVTEPLDDLNPGILPSGPLEVPQAEAKYVYNIFDFFLKLCKYSSA